LAKAMDEQPLGTAGAPILLVLRSRSSSVDFFNALRAGLVAALLVALVLATIASWVVARTITRPLAAVTGAMAHVAATGDLTRRVSLQSRAWDDGDARLLAGAFNRLTESIARFKLEEAQKERLSSLGRLSTVIAHEIRNPLMIIRASLRTLRQRTASPSEVREAVADIDEETARLNRIVTEVLDFAKPIRFDLAEAQINDICQASAAAACAGDSGVRVTFALDPRLPAVVTDAERLRTVFVNILTNARAAVNAVAETGANSVSATHTGLLAPPAIEIVTRQDGTRVLVTIRDRGVGISADDLASIFDPYFTTRRTGTGLGLPIAKNIIEGLGGAITVTSQPGVGTDIAITLPLVRSESAA
jgi:signal transduction histidine kinase